MAAKYYAVRKGKKTGIFRTWEECKAQVHGAKGAEYKSFPTLEEAENFMNMGLHKDTSTPEVYAFVDGSFNNTTKVYGYGGFLQVREEKIILQGSGSEEEMASMRNVAGEVLGSMAAIEKAVELGLPKISIFYDYMGIEMWAIGAWKRNKKGTIAYFDYVQSVKDKIDITFVKVKGHSGVDGNEEADILAKQAVGIL